MDGMEQAQLITRQPSKAETPSRLVSFPWIAFLLAAIAVVTFVVGVLTTRNCPWDAVCGPFVEADLTQGRLNVALPPIEGETTAEQTFVPRHNGLTEVELMAVVYGEEEEKGDGRLTVQLRDEQERVVAKETFAAQSTDHNQTITLRFPPQPHSTGRRYTLHAQGSAESRLSLWGYRPSVYEEGQLLVGGKSLEEGAQTLRFTTRYRLFWSDVVESVAAAVGQEGWLLLAALFFLPLPGILILLIAQPARWDAAAWFGVSLALGVALWPLLWQWWTVVGGRWVGWSLWLFVGLGYSGILVYWLLGRGRGRRASEKINFAPFASLREHLPLTLLLLLALAVRLAAVSDLSFPPWVDSSRHGLITAVMIESGQTPQSYEPYLAVGRFAYHYGFHSLAASLGLMTGWPLPRLLLLLGQLLNGLTPLTVYAATWLLMRRRGPALLAAFLVALPLFFPAYYATWGRMTQLAAVLLLPVLIALTWLMVSKQKGLWPLVGILAAGLFLLHFRVFLFYLPFAGLVGLFALVRRRWLPLILSGGFGLFLILPRLIELIRTTTPAQAVQHAIANYNEFPVGYITVGWERYFIGATAVLLIIVLIAATVRRRWAVFPLLLPTWVATLFVLLAGRRLGLPETSLININSLVITLFVPQSLFLAVVVGHIWRWLASQWARWPGRWLPVIVRQGIGLGLGVLVGLLLLYGIRQQIGILNDTTILAYADDLPALEWAADNLPPDSLVAVNSWQWLGDTWTGHDGGAWLTPLTGVQTTTPPVDYVYDPTLLGFVGDFNEGATAIADWSTTEAAEWLRGQGVTHIFVGARGGFFDPAELVANPQFELLYQRNGVFILRVD